MALNDEFTEKAVNLAVRVGKVTYDELRKVADKLIADLTAGNYPGKNIVNPDKKPELKHGQQTLKQLSKHNDGLSTVELTDPNLRQLQREMKKHNVDFAAVKDGKGKYTLFFKGKDVDSVTHALKSYTQKMVKRDKTNDKPSIKKDLAEAKEAAKVINIKLDKVKDRSRGARAI